jgi:T3SS negative regulator,GrlR
MLRNGSYFAWFRTPLRKGTGVVVFNDGQITGGDIVMKYTGTYVEDGDQFTASIATRRHTPGNSTVFGIDEIDLTVTGNSTPTLASCTGTAKQAPGMAFEATLIPIAD